jgi:hypothetical protein
MRQKQQHAAEAATCGRSSNMRQKQQHAAEAAPAAAWSSRLARNRKLEQRRRNPSLKDDK